MTATVRSRSAAIKASFWRRLAAFTTDAFIVALPCAIVIVLFGLSRIEGYWLNVIANYTYNIILDYVAGGTIGKLYLNIRVVTTDGRPPTLLQCVFRNLAKILSAIPLWYGFLRILSPHVRQTFHDKIARCYVVER